MMVSLVIPRRKGLTRVDSRDVPEERFAIAQVSPFAWETKTEVGEYVARLSEELHRRGHRVLVIANLGLEHPALCAEVCERGARARTEAMIIAPAVASSPLHRLFDDVDLELGVAQGRVDAALETLKANGIKASAINALIMAQTTIWLVMPCGR